MIYRSIQISDVILLLQRFIVLIQKYVNGAHRLFNGANKDSTLHRMLKFKWLLGIIYRAEVDRNIFSVSSYSLSTTFIIKKFPLQNLFQMWFFKFHDTYFYYIAQSSTIIVWIINISISKLWRLQIFEMKTFYISIDLRL